MTTKTSIYQASRSVGTFAGSVIAQGSAKIGGWRHVFYLPQGPRPAPQYPLHGGKIVNPFKGHGKIYAGDMLEHSLDGTLKIFKTYEIAQDTSSDTTKTIYITSGYCENGRVFRHIPFVGDNLMVAPNDFDGVGVGVSVVSVEQTYDAKGQMTGWKVGLSATLGGLKKGAVLVEAAEVGASVKPMVTNPNTYAEIDYDCPFVPATGDEDFDGARYLMTPNMMLGKELAYINRIQPLPAYVLNAERFKSNYPELIRL